MRILATVAAKPISTALVVELANEATAMVAAAAATIPPLAFIGGRLFGLGDFIVAGGRLCALGRISLCDWLGFGGVLRGRLCGDLVIRHLAARQLDLSDLLESALVVQKLFAAGLSWRE